MLIVFIIINNALTNQILLQAVLDHSTWIFNLTAANIQGPGRNPVWFEFYQAKNEYGLADLSPKSMDNFFQRMLTDDALFLRYYKYQTKNLL